MREASEIIHFIEQHMQAMLQNPKGFSSDPMEMEAVLHAIDEIRRFIIVSEWSPGSGHPSQGYFSFCQKKGCGVATFVMRSKIDNPHAQNIDDDFKRLVAFWFEYMESSYFVKVQSDCTP